MCVCYACVSVCVYVCVCVLCVYTYIHKCVYIYICIVKPDIQTIYSYRYSHTSIHTGVRGSSVVRAFAHGAMGRRIDPS